MVDLAYNIQLPQSDLLALENDMRWISQQADTTSQLAYRMAMGDDEAFYRLPKNGSRGCEF